jgi:hypothetical protein
MTRAQKRQLQVYLYFKQRPMTVAGLVLVNWRQLAVMYGFLTIAASYSFASGDLFWCWLYVAASLTVLLRDLGNFIRWSRAWPLTAAVLNWEIIEQLAAEQDVTA